MKSRILVIDDEAAVRDSLKMILEYDGYDCLLAPSGQDGLARVQKDSPDLVFLDVKMPGMDGLDVLRRIRQLDEGLPVAGPRANFSDAKVEECQLHRRSPAWP